MNQSKTNKFIVLLLLLIFVISSCTYLPSLKTETGFQMSETTFSYVAPVGDSNSSYIRDVNFYLPDKFTYKVYQYTQEMLLELSDKSYEQIIEFLLHFKANDTFESPTFGVQIDLYGEQPVSVFANHAIVNLTANALLLTRDEFYLLSTCISETLIEFAGVQSVNVLVADKAVSMSMLSNVPIGALEKATSSAPYTEYIKLLEDRDSINRGVKATDIPVSLFFPSNSGEGILAEGRRVLFSDFEPGNMIIQMLNELSNGPRNFQSSVNIPNFAELLSTIPEISDWGEGGNLVTLRFNAVFDDVLSTTKLHRNTALAMICYTIFDFYPDTAGLRIFIGDERVIQFLPDEIIDEEIYLANELITKKALSKYLLKQTELYFANIDDNQLSYTIRLLPNNMSVSPRNILLQLASGPRELDYIQKPTLPTIPFGIAEEEILGISLENHMLIINFSGTVLEKLKSLDITKEKLFVYSIVNTLCIHDSIKSVMFLFDGQSLDYINGELYWRTEFYPNLKMI